MLKRLFSSQLRINIASNGVDIAVPIFHADYR